MTVVICGAEWNAHGPGGLGVRSAGRPAEGRGRPPSRSGHFYLGRILAGLLICTGSAEGVDFQCRPTVDDGKMAVTNGVWCGRAVEERRSALGGALAFLPRASGQSEMLRLLKAEAAGMCGGFVDASLDGGAAPYDLWFADTNRAAFPRESVSGLVARLTLPTNYFIETPWRLFGGSSCGSGAPWVEPGFEEAAYGWGAMPHILGELVYTELEFDASYTNVYIYAQVSGETGTAMYSFSYVLECWEHNPTDEVNMCEGYPLSGEYYTNTATGDALPDCGTQAVSSAEACPYPAHQGTKTASWVDFVCTQSDVESGYSSTYVYYDADPGASYRGEEGETESVVNRIAGVALTSCYSTVWITGRACSVSRTVWAFTRGDKLSPDYMTITNSRVYAAGVSGGGVMTTNSCFTGEEPDLYEWVTKTSHVETVVWATYTVTNVWDLYAAYRTASSNLWGGYRAEDSFGLLANEPIQRQYTQGVIASWEPSTALQKSYSASANSTYPFPCWDEVQLSSRESVSGMYRQDEFHAGYVRWWKPLFLNKWAFSHGKD